MTVYITEKHFPIIAKLTKVVLQIYYLKHLTGNVSLNEVKLHAQEQEERIVLHRDCSD